MTNKELIDILKMHPEDAEVEIDTDHGLMFLTDDDITLTDDSKLIIIG